MKKIKLLFGVVVLGALFGYVLISRGGLNKSSLVLYATYNGQGTCNGYADAGNYKCSGDSLMYCTGSGWTTIDSCSSQCGCGGSSPDCSGSQAICSSGKTYSCSSGHWQYVLTCTYGCNNTGTGCGAPDNPPATCSSSNCYACNQSNCKSPCLWGYNGSTSMRCYREGEAIPTSKPVEGCENNGGRVPVGSLRCGSGFDTNVLYECTSGGVWIMKTICALSGASCWNDTTGGDSESSCSGDYCTPLGGTCSEPLSAANGSSCNNGTGKVVAGKCLTSGTETARCCVPDYTIIDCTESIQCVLKYSAGYTCVSGECKKPPTPTPTKKPGCTTVINGYCGETSNCLSGKSENGSSEITATGMNYNWTCSGSCGGTSEDCSYTVCTNHPVVNGACKTVASLDDVNNHTLCVHGSEANVTVTEDKITWNCMGSKNTCAEGNGTNALNCTSTIDQGAWFQINNGSILAKGKVSNYVPITCNGNKNGNGENCVSSTVTNGGIYSRLNSSVSGFDQALKNSKNDFSFKTYTYNQLKSQYFDSKGVGTVLTDDNAIWTNVKATSGVIFVDGDLKINSDLDTDKFVMIVAKGTITIDPSVTLINGILVADKVVVSAADAAATSVKVLEINGMVHGVSEIEFSRTLLPKNLNNASPSVVVNYDAEKLFMIPSALSKAFNQWKVN